MTSPSIVVTTKTMNVLLVLQGLLQGLQVVTQASDLASLIGDKPARTVSILVASFSAFLLFVMGKAIVQAANHAGEVLESINVVTEQAENATAKMNTVVNRLQLEQEDKQRRDR